MKDLRPPILLLTLTAIAVAAIFIGCGLHPEKQAAVSPESRSAEDDRDAAALPPPADEAGPAPARSMLKRARRDEFPAAVRPASADWNREAYDHFDENPFRSVLDHPLSTFSIDVDTASYANIRRILNSGRLPPKGAVRIEEMVNYFDYEYGGPEVDDDHPFAAHVSIVGCPWNDAHRLMRVALKGRTMQTDQRPASNLVFLLDVSGSMNPANKLPLVRQAMKMLVQNLGENDRVAIVVYAGASGLVLPSTACDDKQAIVDSLSRLKAGGSTHGASGIRLAYKVARENFITGGVNRVILCTDGDFNVGVTDQGELVKLIRKKAKSGVFLTVLGFGRGNYQDSRLEKLADKGNGNYGYIDTIQEARKVLVEELSGTLVTIAKDVKIQIEFNPAKVSAYRLIGYENRILAKEDFNDDQKDAGEIGAGHTVTALYELVPAGQDAPTSTVDPLKYQKVAVATTDANEISNETLTLKLRYKQPDGDTSTLMTMAVRDETASFANAPQDMKFAAAVAGLGMLLRGSEHGGSFTYDDVIALASSTKGVDRHGYRAEFINLATVAGELASQTTQASAE